MQNVGEKFLSSKRGWGARSLSTFNICSYCIINAYMQLEHQDKLLKEAVAFELQSNVK